MSFNDLKIFPRKAQLASTKRGGPNYVHRKTCFLSGHGAPLTSLVKIGGSMTYWGYHIASPPKDFFQLRISGNQI